MIMFRYYNLLGGDTAEMSGLYASFCHAFLVFNFLVTQNISGVSRLNHRTDFCAV